MAAPFGMRIELRGDKQLIRAMNSLAGGAQRRIARPAVTAGMRPIRKAARSNAPVETGLLKKSIGTIILKKSQTRVPGAVVGIVGPRTGFRQVIDGKPRDPSTYGHLVEFGTSRGVKGARFLTRAFDSQSGAAQVAFITKAREQLVKEITRARRKR